MGWDDAEEIELSDFRKSSNINEQEDCKYELNQFPIIDEPIDYDKFFRRYLETNTPCLIKANSLMGKWPSCKDWVDTGKQIPNLDFFKQIIQSSQYIVPVYKCNTKQRSFNSQETCDMPFMWFLDNWYISPKNGKNSEIYYLKDWHFVKEMPHYKAYRTPLYFCSDWLNEYLDISNVPPRPSVQDFRKSDYKFVYIGPKGSWTPFHSDVFGSYSWSANIVGEKEWLFFPPGSEKFLINKIDRQTIYDISKILPKSDKGASRKWFDQQTFMYDGHAITYYQVRQKSNEIIFVPSGWYHQVRNLKDTISINHNWFNATNVDIIWNELKTELDKVECEIEDCKSGCKDEQEWSDMCQNLLRSSHDMNYKDFINVCSYIAKKRIALLNCIGSDKLSSDEKEESEVLFDGVHLGVNHAIYDLVKIRQILHEIGVSSKQEFDTSEIISAIDNVLVKMQANG